MAKNQITKANYPVMKLKKVLNAESVKEQFKNTLNENAGAFIASIIDLYGSDNYLQKCNPNDVVMEALKAATLKLPINKQLGFAYIVPYKNKPQFQLGYKGYIQLAMRTGQYKFLNAGVIHEGIEIKKDILTGSIEFKGEPTGNKVQGYFAYMELLNGFQKTVYMTKKEIEQHAKRYSKSFNRSSSAWQTNFDEMALKTVMKKLLSKYGILSTEMIAAFTSDSQDVEDEVATEVANEANSEVIDITLEEEPKGKKKKDQIAIEGPGF